MKARGFALALCLLPLGLSAEGPGYFANLRDRTYVEVDESFLVRERAAPPGAPPAFRLRHLVLRVKTGTGFTEQRWWPIRSLFLVTMRADDRWVAEIDADTADAEHPSEPRSWVRLSGGKNAAAFEVFSTNDAAGGDGERASLASESPCGGTRYRFLGGGVEIRDVSAEDVRSRTVAAVLGEIRDALYSPAEILDLVRLKELGVSPRVSGPPAMPNLASGAHLAWNYLLFDKPGPSRGEPSLVLVPDPAPAGDLAPWRALTHIPQDLAPFQPLPEGPLR